MDDKDIIELEILMNHLKDITIPIMNYMTDMTLNLLLQKSKEKEINEIDEN